MTALLVVSCFLVCFVSSQGSDEKIISDEMFSKMFALADADNDGKLSLQELTDHAQKTGVGLAKKESAALLEAQVMGNTDGFYTLDEHLCLLLGVEWEQARKGVLENGEKCIKMPMSDLARQAANVRVDVETLKFGAADANVDGHLDINELHHLLSPETHPAILSITVDAEMSKHDADTDGKLDENEFSQLQESTDHFLSPEDLPFRKLDIDGDGFLSKEELQSGFPGTYNYRHRMTEFFQATDKNADASLSLDEWLIGKKRIFRDAESIKLAKDWGAHHKVLDEL